MSALEAAQAAIARAEQLQGKLNFIVNSDFDRALDRARRGLPAGPFAGVPFLVKDLEDYVGLPMRYGSRANLGLPPSTRQGPLMDVFDRSGLNVIGKSATPEAGFLPTTEPLAFGPTRNPWDPSRSSGGSSGGAAVAVAAGVVPIAHATDGGGSIRIPASACGLFGLKPSRGRQIGTRNERLINDFAVAHVLTRTVRDCAAMLALSEDPGPGSQFPPVGMIGEPLRRRLRIGLLMNGTSDQGPSADVRAATMSAATLCESLGHRVIPTTWPMGPEFIQDFLTLWAAGAAQLAQGVSRGMGRPADGSVLEPFSLGMVEMSRKRGPEALNQAIQRLSANANAYTPWFAAHQFDVVLSPVLQTAAPPLGYVGPDVPFDTLVERLIQYVGYTPYHNIAGAPAMSVPLHWTEAGLPVGTMFAARQGHESLLLQLAYQLEAAQPWAHRIPPIHV